MSLFFRVSLTASSTAWCRLTETTQGLGLKAQGLGLALGLKAQDLGLALKAKSQSLGLGRGLGHGLRRMEALGQGLVQTVKKGMNEGMVMVAEGVMKMDERVCVSYLTLESTLCTLYLLLLQSLQGWVTSLTMATTNIATAITSSLPSLHPPRQDPLTRSARRRVLALVCLAVVAAWVTGGWSWSLSSLSFHGLRSEDNHVSPLVHHHY